MRVVLTHCQMSYIGKRLPRAKSLESMVSQLPSLLIPDTPLSVAELTAHIAGVLEQDQQLQQLWVVGEVSSATQYRSGLFFTLQDPNDKASLSCVVWNNQLPRLMVVPTAGEQLILLGRISLHAQRGQYQLIVWQVLPVGEGLRALRYRQLRDRLAAEGLFDAQRKRPLPRHPQTIAVVTSPRAAAWGDIQRTLKYRYPGLRVQFSPAQVQGEQAPASIVAAIQRVERWGNAEVLILSRGGGATEDMACFNDERVVRAVAACRIPVIAGIGHQRDESLADMAADVCVHTPTAAAELVVPALAVLQVEHQQRIEQLLEVTMHHLQGAELRLQRLRDRLQPRQLSRQVQQESLHVQQLTQRLLRSGRRTLQQAMQSQHHLQEKLETLNPTAVLKRGYALARCDNGNIVRDAAELAVGQRLTIQFGEGKAIVEVIDPPLNDEHQP